MATAEFSEFSFGYALTDSLVSALKGSLGAAPVFPSLLDEGGAGGGYDLKLPALPVPIFLQFKIQQVLSRRSSRMPSGYSPPYYRMPLRTKGSNQHQLLLDLEAANPAAYVLYATPLFDTTAKLDKYFLAKTVHLHTASISPSDIGALDDARHHLSYAPGKAVYWVHSEPRAIQNNFGFDRLSEKLKDRRQRARKMFDVGTERVSHERLGAVQRESLTKVWNWVSRHLRETGSDSVFAEPSAKASDRSTREIAIQLAYVAQVHFGLILVLVDAAPEQADAQ